MLESSQFLVRNESDRRYAFATKVVRFIIRSDHLETLLSGVLILHLAATGRYILNPMFPPSPRGAQVAIENSDC